MGQAVNNLSRQLPLRPQSLPNRYAGQEGIHSYGERFAATRHGAVRCLGVSPEIKAEDTAILMILEETTHAVREILDIDTPRPGTPSLGKDHENLLPLQKMVAFGKGRLHLLPVAAPADGNALCQITQDHHENVPLEIGPFRKIPGETTVISDMPSQRKEGIGHDHGINQGKMIAAYQPWTFVMFKQFGPLTADLVQIPDPVASPFYKQKIKGRQQPGGQETSGGLKTESKSRVIKCGP